MDLAEITDELYALDPGEFVETRNARVKEAKAAGAKDLAAEIGKLRKPTVIAWVINTLARELPDEVAGLLQLGEALRDAQRHLSGSDLRKLTAQRQQVVRAIAKRAGELAAEHGREINEDGLREVAQTLHAALADPSVAERVRAGTLESAETYSGFGPTGLSAVPDEAPRAEPTRARAPERKRRPDKSAKLAAAQRELDEATEALAAAKRGLANARAEEGRAQQDLDDIDQRIADLRDELDRAEQQRQFARTTERNANETSRKAERELARIERWVEKAQDAVDDLAD